MTQSPNSSLARQFCQSSLFVQRLSWIGVVGILNAGVAWSQAPADLAPVEAAPVDAAEMQILPSEPPLDVSGNSESFSAPEPAPSAIESSEPYIDSTQYNLGATDREEAPTIPSWQPDAVDAIANQPDSTSGSVAPADFAITNSVTGQTTAAARYYYRTARPPARLGNGNISLIFPLPIPAAITSAFGWRVHPISGDRRFHSGTDIGAPLGTPVLATYAGRVAIADFLGGYGLTVALQHNKDTQETLYAHLSEIFVKPGEWVEQGTVIGRVGSTGNSTGPHLHFEFRQLSADGWVALDAGTQLEFALAQLVQALQTAQANQKPEKAS
jgi:murein DD-endopeptidase MepM/ murein hydrolase activator NlpD